MDMLKGVSIERIREKQNAYFTVEAALVLPLVMSAMMIGIYLFCYQYNRCLLEQDMGSLLVWGCTAAAEKSGKAEEIKESVLRRASEINRDKYAAWKLTAIDIKLSNNDISLEGRGELVFPVPGWNLWNNDNLWEAEVAFVSERLSPVFFIRQYRKLKKP